MVHRLPVYFHSLVTFGLFLPPSHLAGKEKSPQTPEGRRPAEVSVDLFTCSQPSFSFQASLRNPLPSLSSPLSLLPCIQPSIPALLLTLFSYISAPQQAFGPLGSGIASLLSDLQQQGARQISAKVAQLALVPITCHTFSHSLWQYLPTTHIHMRILLAGVASVFNCTHLSTGIVSTSVNRPELIAAPHVPPMQAVALRYKEREGESSLSVTLHFSLPPPLKPQVHGLVITYARVVFININMFICCNSE